MTVSQTTRLGVYKWSSGNDEFTRDQMTDSHQALEDLVALFTSGTFSARPAAAASNARGFYLATDTNVLYYSNGTAWFSVNSFASPSGLVPGDSNTDGTSTFAARADHKHSLPGWGVTGELQSVATTASGGSTAKFARVDHVHVLGTGSVVSGTLAAGAISAANLFTSQVVERDAIKDLAINKAKLAVDQQIPSGTIMAYGGTSAPEGWLFCDGTSVSTSIYNDLYGAIGYRYGGSGANFNLPDLQNRVPRGASATNAAVTSTSTDDVTIAANNLPTHTHSVGTLAVATHIDHSHTLTGTAAATTAADHYHGTNPHAHSSWVANGTVLGPGIYGTTAGLTGGDDAYQAMPPGWGGRPNNAGIASGYASLQNGTVAVADAAPNTGYAVGSTNHGHSVSGSTAGLVTPLTHTVSGATGNNTTTGTALTIIPRHQTVNYIIKT